MSNKKIDTKEKIVEKALEMYNEQGIEYVGVRELAKELGLKGGNITYYFPTKDDLIDEISMRLMESNRELFAGLEDNTMYNFLEMHKRIYNNQYKYRSLMISLPLLLQQDKAYTAKYRENVVSRKKMIYNQLKALFLAGYMQGSKVDTLDAILYSIIMQNRLWLSEATMDNALHNSNLVIATYLKRLANLLSLTATEKGQADINRFLAELQ